jgi:hypothetical protein
MAEAEADRVSIDDGHVQAWLAGLCDAIAGLREVAGPATELPVPDWPRWSDLDARFIKGRVAAERRFREFDHAVNPHDKPLDDLTLGDHCIASTDDVFGAAWARAVALYVGIGERIARSPDGRRGVPYCLATVITLTAREHDALGQCERTLRGYVRPAGSPEVVADASSPRGDWSRGQPLGYRVRNAITHLKEESRRAGRCLISVSEVCALLGIDRKHFTRRNPDLVDEINFARECWRSGDPMRW